MLSENVGMATGIPPPKILKTLWLTVTPILVVIIMIFSIIGYTKITYGNYNVSIVGKIKIFSQNSSIQVGLKVSAGYWQVYHWFAFQSVHFMKYILENRQIFQH